MTQYKRIPNHEATKLDEEWVILNPDKYTVTKLNEMGGHCWAWLDEPQTLASLLETIEQNYKLAATDKVENDLKAFLNELMECGLVQYAV